MAFKHSVENSNYFVRVFKCFVRAINRSVEHVKHSEEKIKLSEEAINHSEEAIKYNLLFYNTLQPFYENQFIQQSIDN
ncbi:hypothetical protein ASG22_06055 [Chryseobacterium sp. Leaf405]|nr:hypothetical protein ASG22_06055 [Chryseobacterium sp. Leaf405]